MHFRMIAAVLCLALPVAVAQAAPSSTFASSAEGWSVVDFLTANTYVTPDTTNLSLTYSATGGPANGGYISRRDPSSGSFFFQANSSFTGDLSSYFGGTLSYAEKIEVSSGYDQWRGDPDLVLVSGGKAYVYQGSTNPGTTWTNVSINLSGTGWLKDSLYGSAVSTTEFKSVLANVSAVYIRGETITGLVETAKLTNVTISAAVPEPETYAMLLAGLGLVGFAARRRS